MIKTIDEIIDQNFIIDGICSTKDNLKAEISELVSEIIGEDCVDFRGASDANERDRVDGYKNDLRHEQLNRARERGLKL